MMDAGPRRNLGSLAANSPEAARRRGALEAMNLIRTTSTSTKTYKNVRINEPIADKEAVHARQGLGSRGTKRGGGWIFSFTALK